MSTFHIARAGRTTRCLLVAAAACAVLATGCATPREMRHHFPVERDYRDLPQTPLAEAEQSVQQARRAGADGFDAHAYAAAVNYLALAHDAHYRGDEQGVWDYATLAVRHAKEASAATPDGLSGLAAEEPPPNAEAARRALDDLSAAWHALDSERAAYALPVLFADITALISRIEHELNRGAWEIAAQRIPEAEAMLRTLQARDMDGDGMPDLVDDDPWQPPAVIEPPPPPPLLQPILFGSGSVMIDAEAMGYLRGVADFLRQAPGWTLLVSGHTDSRHSESYSLDLSRRRAEAVARFLVGVGAPADRVTTAYYGAAHPLEPAAEGVPNATNRRVSLELQNRPEETP